MKNKDVNFFDLNIKKILKNWNISDAIRELIANAIDESVLTNTQIPKIYKGDETKFGNEKWIIQDWGRGLNIPNFSQNENNEKINSSQSIIGKFGIGLKDAIAVLYRNKINFKIYSHNLIMYPILENKENFDIQTIHIKIEKHSKKIKGTKIVFENLKDIDVDKAKSNFLIFQNNNIYFENEYGAIIEKKDNAYIYVNGMKIDINDSYIFSYNIKKPNTKLNSKMNRDRKSLGREVYSDIIEKIITPYIPKKVIDIFWENRHKSGELHKKNIREMLYNKLNEYDRYVFVTQKAFKKMTNREKEVILSLNKEVEIVKDDDSNLVDKLYNMYDAWDDYKKNFVFDEINLKLLSHKEKSTLEKLNTILKKIDNKKEIVIVKKNNNLNQDVWGYWGKEKPNKIFIVKLVLQNPEEAIKTLIHEYAHSVHGFGDSSREFEKDLENIWYKVSNLNIIK